MYACRYRRTAYKRVYKCTLPALYEVFILFCRLVGSQQQPLHHLILFVATCFSYGRVHLLFTKYTYQFRPFSFANIFWFVSVLMHTGTHSQWNMLRERQRATPFGAFKQISTKPVRIPFASTLSLFPICLAALLVEMGWLQLISHPPKLRYFCVTLDEARFFHFSN